MNQVAAIPTKAPAAPVILDHYPIDLSNRHGGIGLVVDLLKNTTWGAATRPTSLAWRLRNHTGFGLGLTIHAKHIATAEMLLEDNGIDPDAVDPDRETMARIQRLAGALADKRGHIS